MPGLDGEPPGTALALRGGRMTIKQLKADVRSVGLPPGWTATSCFMLGMVSGRTSDEMVGLNRDDKPLADSLRGLDRKDAVGRVAVRREWYRETKRQADGLREVLAAAGFAVRQDGGSLYVTGRRTA